MPTKKKKAVKPTKVKAKKALKKLAPAGIKRKKAPKKAAPAKKTTAASLKYFIPKPQIRGKSSFKKEMREKLVREKHILLKDVTHKVKTESNVLKFEIGDIYDIASAERERELALMLGDREREKLHEIDRALERLNNKDYGICEDCGEPIGDERLRALPFTVVCVDCKSKAERERLLKGRLEEEPAVGAIEGSEQEEEEY